MAKYEVKNALSYNPLHRDSLREEDFMFKKLLLLKSIPVSQDAGLLALRLIAVTPLLLKHGLEKLFGFSHMTAYGMDPIHIGPVPTLLYATFADGICTVLIILGLGTRWAAVISFINLGVAWAFMHHFVFFGPRGDHGELIVLYIAVMVTLFLAGAGKYSIDALLDE
jgi:putative oxidoreductase